MKNTINTTLENRDLYSYEYELQTENILDFDPTDIINILNRKDIFNYITDENKEVILHELSEHILYMGTSENDLIALFNYMFYDFVMGDSVSVYTIKEFLNYIEKQRFSTSELIDFLADISLDLSSCPIDGNDINDIFVIDTYTEKTYFESSSDYFENNAEILAREILTNADNEGMSVQEYIDLAISEGATTIDYIPKL